MLARQRAVHREFLKCQRAAGGSARPQAKAGLPAADDAALCDFKASVAEWERMVGAPGAGEGTPTL
jgi:hypothetical protein